ncbi:MAG TPA: hypothetical protein VE866_06060, partial [Candidatus Binatia bacterium]|nr:hypothetical protein [Candidatus Binatia bacterium]
MSRTRIQPSTDQEQSLSHEDLRKAAICWLKLRKYDYRNQIPIGGNCTILTSEIVSNASDNPDAIGWNMGHSVLVECKASRADYHRDQKKPQRQVGTGMGEHRYYFTPKGLLSPEEIPEGWGLVEYENGKASITIHA